VNYAKYLDKNNRVTLKTAVEDPGAKKLFATVFAYIVSCRGSKLELIFLNSDNNNTDYPFQPRQRIELLAEHNETGISCRALFVKRLSDQRLIVELSGDLNFFNQRRSARISSELWIAVEESHVSKAIIRERWERATSKNKRTAGAPLSANFSRKEISLSSSGLGMEYPKPVQPGTYFLIYLAFENNEELIPIAGEVVRSEPGQDNSFYLGIHFDFIEEDDRLRIQQFAKLSTK